MKLYKSWLLPATCTIILVVTTYATTTQTAKRKQEEVNLQVAVSPSRLLKYGDKTTKKIQNEEVLFVPTSPTLTIEKQQVSRSRPRPRIERIELATNQANVQISPRNTSQQNEFGVQHEIPIVQNNRKLYNKPVTPIVSQQSTEISNRTRSTNRLIQTQQQQQVQTQPTQYSNLNIESEKNVTITKTTTTSTTTTKSRQRKPTTTSRTISSAITNQPPFSSHNSNVRTHHPSNSNSTITRHYHGNQRNKNNHSTNRTQSLLGSSHAVATSGLQSKTEINSHKQTGNISDNQSVSSKSTKCSNVRKFTSNASTITIISSTSTSTTTSTSSSHAVATSGLQSKTEINSHKQTGNISDNQSVSSKSTKRSNVRKFTSNASTITIISSTSTSTTTSTTPRPSFQLPANFNIFTPEFWQFLSPTSSIIPRIQATALSSTTTRKPPKKYKPPTQISTKEEKLSLIKPKPTVLHRTTTKQPEIDTNYNDKNNNTPKKDEGPFRIALPTLNILSSKRETHNEVEKGKRNVEKEANLRARYDCPRESEVRFQLFPKICKIDEDCKVWNREEICCDIFGAKSCVSGIPKPLEETSHAPILGVIPRKCPNIPLAELWWEVKECETDMDCWPRVCCPDGRKRYCRTSQPELNTVPVPVQRSFNYLSEYLECTPPPPPIFDLHPKPCTSTLDCFPNVCCQESGLRHCRPPKKSVLTMLANVFNVDFVKRLTQNIVIK